ncbi:MAG: L-glutamate gamma-semialdehyde dehydrogenase [Thermoplasmatota archaeon]
MVWNLSKPDNEMDEIYDYSPGSKEREELQEELEKIKSETVEIPLIIGGEEVYTDKTTKVKCPHDHDNVLAEVHLAREDEIESAIEAVLDAHDGWGKKNWYHRAATFRKAADLLAGPKRIRNIAAIMMNQSKNPYESEIDLAELVDFWRINTYFMKFIYEQQPEQSRGELNRLDWRPLEGFIFAVPPFNFYSIAGNLPSAPAIVGNTVLWKPSKQVAFSNFEIMKILMEAGLDDGVINFLQFPTDLSDIIFEDHNFAGLHFTGSYATLTKLWDIISENIEDYKNFPRIVGEGGGKDFIFVHPSAELKDTLYNIIRGGFGYQGQKCSAAARVYVPESMWDELEERLRDELPSITYGPTDDMDNYMGALIDESAFEKVTGYIDHAKEHPDDYEFIYGGDSDDSRGWFVEPTVIRSEDPKGKLMEEEIFGPVVTIYVYPDDEYEETLELCDSTSPYGLTGSIFSKDSGAIHTAENKLRYAAGNFYINDKPTGAIVNRQPFGGARSSGTNDKAGHWINLLRWLSPRAIKETILPTEDWRRKFMKK